MQEGGRIIDDEDECKVEGKSHTVYRGTYTHNLEKKKTDEEEKQEK